MNLQNASYTVDNRTLVTDLHESLSVLNNVDWNFFQKSAFSHGEMQPFKSSSHHWCPATFVPEIPFTLIEVLSLPSAVVYDPFGGIGTTFFQALILNRQPVTTEICRISVEYMRSLFLLFDPSLDTIKINHKIASVIHLYKSDVDYVSEVDVTRTSIDKLKPWYSAKTLNELSFLICQQHNCQDDHVKAAMWISISAILQTASSQDRGWGCIADNMLPKPEKIKDKNALTLFTGHANRLLDDITAHLKCAIPGYNEMYKELSSRQNIFHRDVREATEIPTNSVDLVVTSPPYPNMTDYVTSRRLSYYFVGREMTSDSNMEIGARLRRTRKDALTSYFESMSQANKNIASKIKQDGYACYVMPEFDTANENNKSRKQVVSDLMSKIEDFGLKRVAEFERILPSKKRQHNTKWASLQRETIYLFKKA